MGSAKIGGHPAPEGRQIATTPPPLDVYDNFPNESCKYDKQIFFNEVHLKIPQDEMDETNILWK